MVEIVYHGFVFAIGITLLILLASFVVATTIRSLITDVAWYSEAVRSASETIRVVAVYDGNTLYYAMMNAGVEPVSVQRVDMITSAGGSIFLSSPGTLQPGQVYQGSLNVGATQPVAVVVTTARGNTFAGRVYSTAVGTATISIRGLLPALHVLNSPFPYTFQLQPPYNESKAPVLTVATRGYVFGFVYVRELENGTTVLFDLGSHSVEHLHSTCTNCSVLLNITRNTVRSTGGGVLNVTVKLILRLLISGENVSYRLSMPINATVVSSRTAGVYVRGCVGFGWKISSSTVFSFTETTTLPSTYKSTAAHFYVDDLVVLYIPAYQVPSLSSLATVLLPLFTGEVSVKTTTPIAGYGDVVFARCFAGGDKASNSVVFSPDDTPSTTHGGITYYSYIVFPGANPHATSTVVVNSIDLQLDVRGDVLVRHLLSLP